MHQDEVLNRLVSEHPDIISTNFSMPEPYYEVQGDIKAIVLGADPTHIVDTEPIEIKVVFGLDKGMKSKYWRSTINTNLLQIGLTLDNIYDQNVCRNFFTVETSKNKNWVKIARDYWIPLLREELDEKFDQTIPVLMTTEFILWAVMEGEVRRVNAKDIYTKSIFIHAEENLLKRKLLAFYRNKDYSLRQEKWNEYRNFLIQQVTSLH